MFSSQVEDEETGSRDLLSSLFKRKDEFAGDLRFPFLSQLPLVRFHSVPGFHCKCERKEQQIGNEKKGFWGKPLRVGSGIRATNKA